MQARDPLGRELTFNGRQMYLLWRDNTGGQDGLPYMRKQRRKEQ